MKSALSTLELLLPRTLEEALKHMAAKDRPMPLAGGTDLFVYLNGGAQPECRYMDVSRLAVLRHVLVGRNTITIGGGVTFRAIREHAEIRRRFPSLTAVAAEVGAWQIQNRATIAGNIANASPAGDSLPVLLAHDATVHVRSTRGVRDVAFADLYLGYRKLAIEPDELITAVTLTSPPKWTCAFFRKVGTRRAQSISKVVFAGVLAARPGQEVTHVRLAYGSMAATPARARHAEEALLGRRLTAGTVAAARSALARDFTPIDDIRSERDYRMAVAENVLEQFLRSAPNTSRR
ncbi:MAG: xanthine dehydrogenase family protein subunit M [Candidatus Eisenbacteria bacterium]